MESLPAIVRARLLAPGKHLKPEEALAVLDICVSIGAEKAALAADRRAVLIIGNTGTLVLDKISPLAVFTPSKLVGSGKSTFTNYIAGCTMTRIKRVRPHQKEF